MAICTTFVNLLGYSNLDDFQSNKIIEEIYKNKTIIINYTNNENNMFVKIDGIHIDVLKINSTFYTPLLPYQSYSSPINLSKDIIKFFLINNTDNQK